MGRPKFGLGAVFRTRKCVFNCSLAILFIASMLLSNIAKAVDPATAAAITKTATDVLRELPSAFRWGGSQVRKLRKGSSSITQIIDITPTVNNSALFAISINCGFRANNKLGRRYVREVSLYYFDKKIAGKRYGNGEAERNKVVQLKSNNIVPRSIVEEALRAGKSELSMTIRAKANCETYNERKKRFRGKHSANPVDTTQLTLKLPKVKSKATKKKSSKKKSSSKKKPKKTSTSKKEKFKSKSPNLQIKVTNKAKSLVVAQCPRYVHFTGMIRFNAAGTYSYYFDAEDGTKTSEKQLVTNGSGKKEFYWNRRIKKGNAKNSKSAGSGYALKGKKSSSVFEGWTRINVFARFGKGPKRLFQSKPLKFSAKCK